MAQISHMKAFLKAHAFYIHRNLFSRALNALNSNKILVWSVTSFPVPWEIAIGSRFKKQKKGKADGGRALWQSITTYNRRQQSMKSKACIKTQEKQSCLGSPSLWTELAVSKSLYHTIKMDILNDHLSLSQKLKCTMLSIY